MKLLKNCDLTASEIIQKRKRMRIYVNYGTIVKKEVWSLAEAREWLVRCNQANMYILYYIFGMERCT